MKMQCNREQPISFNSYVQPAKIGHLARVRRFYTLQHTATHCNTLQHTATHHKDKSSYAYWLLQHTAKYCMHCNALQHTATSANISHPTRLCHCNTLQHAATHCNALQHTANIRHPTRLCHYNTLQHTAAY